VLEISVIGHARVVESDVGVKVHAQHREDEQRDEQQSADVDQLRNGKDERLEDDPDIGLA
jgi:hypothetical protein